MQTATKLYDISVPLNDKSPVWPGDPQVVIRQLSAISKGDETNVSQFRMSVHSGTHIDAPKHFINKAHGVGQINLKLLIGEVLIFEIDPIIRVISEDVLKSHYQWNQVGMIPKVIFKTRNSAFWSESPDTFRKDYTALDRSGAMALAEKNLDLVGIDYLSIALFEETALPHEILLSKNIILLEAVNLSGVEPGLYQLICLPILLADCEGAPARAILLKP